MKRIEGVSDCPTNCLCSQNIEITYKVYFAMRQSCMFPHVMLAWCRIHAFFLSSLHSKLVAFFPGLSLVSKPMNRVCDVFGLL